MGSGKEAGPAWPRLLSLLPAPTKAEEGPPRGAVGDVAGDFGHLRRRRGHRRLRPGLPHPSRGLAGTGEDEKKQSFEGNRGAGGGRCTRGRRPRWLRWQEKGVGRVAGVGGSWWWLLEGEKSTGWPGRRGNRMVEAAAGLGRRGHGALRRGARGWGEPQRRGECDGQLWRRGEGLGSPEPRRNRGGHGDLRRKEEGAEDSGGLGRQMRSG